MEQKTGAKFHSGGRKECTLRDLEHRRDLMDAAGKPSWRGPCAWVSTH